MRRGAIRFTIGRMAGEEQLDWAAECLRERSPYERAYAMSSALRSLNGPNADACLDRQLLLAEPKGFPTLSNDGRDAH